MTDIDLVMDEIESLLHDHLSAVDSYKHSNTCDKLTYLEQRQDMYKTRNKLLNYIREAIESGAGIMDQIRHEQIEELNEAIDWYRKRNKDD